jgi:hypothetical protein
MVIDIGHEVLRQPGIVTLGRTRKVHHSPVSHPAVQKTKETIDKKKKQAASNWQSESKQQPQ